MPQYEYVIPVQSPNIQWIWSNIISQVSPDLISIEIGGVFTITFAQTLIGDKLSILDNIMAACPNNAPDRLLSKWAFRSRFTFEERMLLDNSTNPAVIVLRNDLSSADYIDLDDPAVSQGFDLLIYNSILTPTRKAEILA